MLKKAGISHDLEQAVGEEVATILSSYGIKYNPEIHEFLSRKKRPVESIASLLTTQETKNIVAILSSLRAEKLEEAANVVKNDFKTEFAPFGVSESEFSKLLQSSTGKPRAEYLKTELEPIINKLNSKGLDGLKIVTDYQTRFHNSIYSTLRSAKDSEHLKSLFVGRVTPQLLQKIFENKNQQEAVDMLTRLIEGNFEAYTKAELLDAAGFSESRHPLSATRYWPDIDAKNKSLIQEKIAETIDLDAPQVIAEVIVSVQKNLPITSVDQQRIRALYANRFNKNTDGFLEFIKKAFLEMGYNESYLDDFILQVKDYASEEKMDKKDLLFNDYESYFDSREERQIVDLIRNTFNLQCVASDIKIPKPEDFVLNKKRFVVDFIIYCDVFNGVKAIDENGTTYEKPEIEKQVILIGEYYGFGGEQVALNAPQDLYDPDGNLLYPKGTPLTRSQRYEYKTQYKKITESFCSQAIGCKTISINQASSTKTQKEEVEKGLQENNVLFSTEDRRIQESMALYQLIQWYKNADDLSKERSAQEVSRYFDIGTLKPKAGQEFKETKYSAAIQAAIKNINAAELEIVVSQNRKNFVTKNLRPGQQSASYLAQIKNVLKILKTTNQWRYDMLQQMNTEIANSKAPVNDRLFMEKIRALQDLSNSENEIPVFNIFKTAFNLKSFFKVA